MQKILFLDRKVITNESWILPISKEDMKEAGIEQLDFVYICGDAYVDHPSFGHAIISRIWRLML